MTFCISRFISFSSDPYVKTRLTDRSGQQLHTASHTEPLAGGTRTVQMVRRERLKVSQRFRLGRRYLGDMTRLKSDSVRVDLDSHAEQCCVSEDTALIIHDHETTITASGFDGKHSVQVKVVDAVVKYIEPLTGQVWMLVINQALLVPGMTHNLLCPMQLRLNDIRVNDEPKHLALIPTEYHNAIAIKIPDEDGGHQELIIPLRLSSSFSYFCVT